MTEAETRTLLHDRAGSAGLERWIVEQPWQATSDGWTVPGELYGWHFRLTHTPDGVRITVTAPSGRTRTVFRTMVVR